MTGGPMRFSFLPARFLVLLPLIACSADPTPTGAAAYRSEAKTASCISWCERERAQGCKDASPRLDDCAAYCAGPAGCGDAAPLLLCTDEHPDAIRCDGSSLGYGPPCTKIADAFLEGANPCKSDDVGVVRNPNNK